MNARTTAIAAFKATIAPLGGTIKKQNKTAQRVYCRAVLPVTEEVQPKDLLKPGVAIRASGLAIKIVPYVFREICSNGAIWAHSSEAMSLSIPADATAATIEDFVRTATAKAASEKAIAACLAEVQASTDTKLTPIQLIASMPTKGILDRDLVTAVMHELTRQPEALSRYDAMNIVTAFARDTDDPEAQWKLESFATSLLIGATAPAPRFDSSLAASHCV